MLKRIPFSSADIEALKSQPRTFKFTFILLLIIYVPLCFVIGLVGLFKKGYGYWPTTIAFLCFFTAVALFTFIRDYIRYKKDMKFQIKLSGDLLVKSKSEKRGARVIHFDSNQIKQLSLISKTGFEKLLEGDIINIEISKYSKYIFSLKKGTESLIENS